MSEKFEFKIELIEEVYEFLNELQETAAINMLGAGSYIENNFDVNKKESRALLASWLTFKNTKNLNK